MLQDKLTRLSVIIPLYNEEATITQILDKLIKVQLAPQITLEIIIVDDGSTDRSIKLVEEFISNYASYPIRLYKQTQNIGKGAAIHKGIQLSTGEYVIIQDADLEYDPEDFKLMIEPVISGKADVVYGSRFKGSKPHRMMFYWHSVGNKILTNLCNLFSNLNLSDMETCYKLVNRRILNSLNLKEKRFGFEPELTIKLSRIPNIRIYEVGIAYYGRSFAEGKKINYKDGFRAIYCILKYGLFKI